MKTIINTRLYGADAPVWFEKYIKDNPLTMFVEYDKSTGIALVNSEEKSLISSLLKLIGGNYPLALVVSSDSEDEQVVWKVYDDLSDSDKAHVEIVPADVGCRVSVFIDQERDDLTERFWSALYPSGTDDTRMIGGRVRDYPEMKVKLPAEMETAALSVGDWTKTVIKSDGFYVVEGFLGTLYEEEQRLEQQQKIKTYSEKLKSKKRSDRSR